MTTIKSWSPTRLTDFESCAYKAKLKLIDKIPEPERPLPPGKTEHANDRGTRIHSEIELFVRGQGPFPADVAVFKDELNNLAARYKEGTVSLEGEWGFDRKWLPCEYEKAWLRMKCDAVVHLSPKHIVVIDFKTGRKFGNEIKHAEQVQIYAIAAIIRNPNAETIDVELWYSDQKPGQNFTHESKPAKKWLYHLKAFHNRGLKMTSETEFKPNPNAFSCKWCPYREGICQYAHKPAEIKPVRRKGQ